jgi:hypothetical protein
LCLGLLHTTGICNETFHGVIGGRLFNHLDLSPLLFCSPQALLVRCDTFDRVFGLLDSLVDGLIDVLIDSILRFALGAFGGSIPDVAQRNSAFAFAGLGICLSCPLPLRVRSAYG